MAFISGPHTPMAQCCFYAAMWPRTTPRTTKNGMLHLIASSISGQALCTSSRMCVRIGCAKGCAFAMYASTFGLNSEFFTTAVYLQRQAVSPGLGFGAAASGLVG